MGTVIGIFSAKGGVGKTLLATNLGVAIGVGLHRKTALIDLNPGTGTADLLLDLDPERSLSDLIPVIDEITPQHIHLAVTEFRPGVDLLAATREISWKGSLSKKDLKALLDAFREEYDLVVLDTSSTSSDTGIALDLVDIRLMILTPDAPALRATAQLLDALDEKEVKTGLIINQQSTGSAINPDEIKDHLDLPIFGVFPIDPASVWSNISYGEPCVLRRNSKLGKAIRQLSTRLLKLIEQMEN
jgi:pilus assembly protein CpaE